MHHDTYHGLEQPCCGSHPELDAKQASYYQSHIGVLRCCVEIRRIDIITKVLLLLSHLALPRKGHLEAVFHCFAYVEKKHNSHVIFDPTYPKIDMQDFKECDWKAFYGDVKEDNKLLKMPLRCKGKILTSSYVCRFGIMWGRAFDPMIHKPHS